MQLANNFETDKEIFDNIDNLIFVEIGVLKSTNGVLELTSLFKSPKEPIAFLAIGMDGLSNYFPITKTVSKEEILTICKKLTNHPVSNNLLDTQSEQLQNTLLIDDLDSILDADEPQPIESPRIKHLTPRTPEKQVTKTVENPKSILKTQGAPSRAKSDTMNTDYRIPTPTLEPVLPSPTAIKGWNIRQTDEIMKSLRDSQSPTRGNSTTLPPPKLHKPKQRRLGELFRRWRKMKQPWIK